MGCRVRTETSERQNVAWSELDSRERYLSVRRVGSAHMSYYHYIGAGLCLCGFPWSDHLNSICPWDRDIEETLNWQLMTNAEREEFKRTHLWVSAESLCSDVLEETWPAIPMVLTKQAG